MEESLGIQEYPPEINLDDYTDLSVGEILCRTREHYGQTLEQVELNLRIRASQLQALEQLDLDALPGRVYAIGFVRSYAEYLGLDGDKMVHLFKSQSVGRTAKMELHFPVSAVESKVPNVYLVIGSLVALILLIAFWTIFYTPTQYVERIPSVPKLLKEGNASLLAPPAKAEAGSVLSAEKENVMELVINSDSWVEIKNTKSEVILRRVLKAGDKYKVPEEEGLVLTTGNAGGITVFVNGKKIRTLGKKAAVKRDVSLSMKDFR